MTVAYFETLIDCIAYNVEHHEEEAGEPAQRLNPGVVSGGLRWEGPGHARSGGSHGRQCNEPQRADRLYNRPAKTFS